MRHMGVGRSPANHVSQYWIQKTKWGPILGNIGRTLWFLGNGRLDRLIRWIGIGEVRNRPVSSYGFWRGGEETAPPDYSNAQLNRLFTTLTLP